MRQTNRHRTWAKAAITVAALLLASCSMMKEDRSDCPGCRNPLHIKVRYDYNIQRANMFADHVEQATVYVVDPATGSVVDWQSASVRSIAPQAEAVSPFGGEHSALAFNFEGLAPGSYRLFAIARSVADAAYKTSKPDIAQSIEGLRFTVPTDANGYHQMSSPFITGKSGASDIVIEGESRTTSIIDGQGAPWWDQVETACQECSSGYYHHTTACRGSSIEGSLNGRCIVL